MPLAGLAHMLDTFARRMGFTGVHGRRNTSRFWITPEEGEAALDG